MKRSAHVLTLTSTAIAAICCMLLAACSQKPDGKRTVVVSIPPQMSLLHEITGDSIDIVTLITTEANPESFELSVADMRSINNADAYISVGQMPFEQSVLEKIKENNPDMLLFDISEGIDLIYGTHDHDDKTGATADPHIWSSVRNMRIISENMLKAMKIIDPANAGFYDCNHSRLDARLDSIDKAFIARIHNDSAAFLVWHPSLSYLARDYGLNQIAIGKENKETSVNQMKESINTAARSDIKAFFIQSNFDPRQAENLSKQIGIDPVAINPLDPDWEKQLTIVIDEISRNHTD